MLELQFLKVGLLKDIWMRNVLTGFLTFPEVCGGHDNTNLHQDMVEGSKKVT